MFAKGIRGTLYVILLGAVVAISALPAAAQNAQSTVTKAATKAATTTKNYVAPTSTRNVEYGKEIEFNGNISRIDGDMIGVVDSEGAETAVLLAPGTKIKGTGGGKHAHLMATGASSSSDRSALVVGLPVEVEGHGNCEGQLIAESVKFRYNPCLCQSHAEHGSPASNTK